MCTIKEVIAFSDDEVSRKCLERLSKEKTLLSQLSHENIIQYYGFDLRGKKLSVYLEYTSRGSVLQLLQEYGPLGELVVQNYAQQVVMNKEAYNLAADIWSLGCTVFEMATSKPPWSQYEGAAAIYKIGKSKDAPEIPNHLSADAKSFIRQCLQREPSARPAAKQLLKHPFIRNQTILRERRDPSLRPATKPMLCHLSLRNKVTSRVNNANNMTIEALSRALGGNCIQYAQEIQSKRIGTGSIQQSGKVNSSYSSRSTVPRTFIVTRDCRGISHSPNTIDEKSPVRPNTMRSRSDPWLDFPRFGAGTDLVEVQQEQCHRVQE